MYPKQLLPLTGDETMLQQTAQRLNGMDDASDECVVVCNEAHRFLVAEQLLAIDKSAQIVLEPEGRNTAPAVALAAFMAVDKDPDTMLLVASWLRSALFLRTRRPATVTCKRNPMVTRRLRLTRL
jgi:mannose-1-phosphate guanylyltransferase